MNLWALPKARSLSCGAAITVLVTSLPARADDPTTPGVSLAGFGTLGVVHSSESLADASAAHLQPNGAGYTRNWSASVDSLVAAQLTARLTRILTAIVQVVAEQNYNDSYWPHIEWANLKYQITPDFSVRAGRIALPAFMAADTRLVGYVNPWARPPVEVYGIVPITRSDGVDASYTLHLGSLTQTLVGSFGYTAQQTPGGTVAHSRHLWLIADTVEYKAVTLHAAYQQGRLSLSTLTDAFGQFHQFGPQGDAINARYAPDNKLLRFGSVGVMLDPGRWFATVEWGSANFNSALGKRTGWYASGGYRLAKFTPYLSLARAMTDNLSDPGLTVSALPPQLQAPATGLNGFLNSLLSTKAVQKTVSIGTRWDFRKNADLKLQLDRTFIGTGSSGTLINVQPGYQLGSNLSVFSATLDFVF